MKAKEYAQWIIDIAKEPDDVFDRVMWEVSRDLMVEVGELIKTRHCHYDAASIAVLDEIDNKYQAICRIVNEKLGVELLYKTGFREMVLNQADKAGYWQLAVAWKPKKIGGMK